MPVELDGGAGPRADRRRRLGARRSPTADERPHASTSTSTGLEPGDDLLLRVRGRRRALAGRAHADAAGPSADRIRFATCSCAKFNAGYFNAYARIAERDDLDFLLHLGDYIYEARQRAGEGRRRPGADIGRPFEPEGECRTLAEYRTRYAQYHRDPDVQALHHSLPMIADAGRPRARRRRLGRGRRRPRSRTSTGPGRAAGPGLPGALREWLPVRPPDPADPTRVFRTVALGDARRDLPDRHPQPPRPAGAGAGDERPRPLDAGRRAARVALRQLDASTAGLAPGRHPRRCCMRTWVRGSRRAAADRAA